MRRLTVVSVLFSLCVAASALSGCHRKNRLSSSDFDFRISPPAATVVKGSSVTLTAISGSAEINPSWTLSGAGSLSTSIGQSVDFNADTLGDARITATYDGVATTAQIAVVAYAPNANILEVYSDSLFPSMPGVVGTNPIFDGSSFALGSSSELDSGYTPQGVKYFRIVSSVAGSNMYWGIVLNGTPTNVDVTAYTTLSFDLRINHNGGLGAPPVNVLIELEDQATVKHGVTLDGTHGLNRLSEDWQEIRIPRTAFASQGVNTAALHVPFIITLQNCPSGTTFDVDAIRWEK